MINIFPLHKIVKILGVIGGCSSDNNGGDNVLLTLPMPMQFLLEHMPTL
jgi:hypothetical protein